ncbi:peptide MFS transporter [Pseudoflavitalea sp. G-6-1-2]|uniref:peptide MFS transporter n=1 Tax=Pseudoflavitalea sp. G-6-1-2 TaxID=2728841 RepID=UPI00197E1D55|nr:peptide MFS transporter [Pseudoflavitalea sp. G-6-1-2]
MSQPAAGKHPKGLFVLFFTEMWERFSYYGMRALLVLYVVNALGQSDKYANDDVYGSYTGLAFLTPLLGGYFADRLWGNRRSIIVGGFMIAAGQMLMFFSASVYSQVAFSTTIMWAGLLVIALGTGFLKPNVSSLVGALYTKDDKRLDSAYTIFYMGINLGAFIGPLICGGFGELYDSKKQAIPEAFKWGYFAAAVAMVLGTFGFIWLKNKYVVDPQGNSIGILPNKNVIKEEGQKTESTKSSLTAVGIWGAIGLAMFFVFRYVGGLDFIGCFIFSVAIAVSGIILFDQSLTPSERGRVIVIFISAFFVIFFWAAFEQAGSSLTLFAQRNTDRAYQVHTSLGTAILFILAISVVLYYFLQRMMEIPSELKKLFAGLAIGAVIIAIYYYVKGTPYDLEEIPASWFNSVNSMWLILCAPFLSYLWQFLGKKGLEPSSPKKQAIGLLLLAAGYLLIAYGVKDVIGTVSMMWLLGLYFLHTVGELCLSPIGLSLVNKLAPARFTSILMGVWFLSNAVANKFGGKLGGLIPSQGPTQFLGYQINNLYDFFMLFVVISAIAAALLFSISYWMEKRMGTVK